MTRSLLAAALTAVTALVPAAPATAVTGQPGGQSCSFLAWPAGIGENGIVAGGPLTDAYEDGDATLRCSVQVADSTHDAEDVASEAAVNTYSVTLNPRFAEFDLFAGPLFLCTEWTRSDGWTLYWDTTTRRWATDASAATCAEIVAADTSAADARGALALACELLPQVFEGSLGGGLVTVGEDGDVHVAGTPVLGCPPGPDPVPRQQDFFVAPPMPIGVQN